MMGLMGMGTWRYKMPMGFGITQVGHNITIILIYFILIDGVGVGEGGIAVDNHLSI